MLHNHYSFGYHHAQRQASRMIKCGSYLSYAEIMSIRESCEVERIAESTPEYQLYLALQEQGNERGEYIGD